MNGYLKSAESLAENGQVTEMEVHVYAANREDWREKMKVSKTQFNDSLTKLPGAAAQWVFDGGDGNVPAKRFRLTIKKAEAGTRYSDRAISELYILGWPP